MDSAVPIVTDSCGVYGTFYMDLMGSGLKTFNSPRCGPKMSHGPPHQQGAETIQIFPQPVGKTPPLGSVEALPWKQAIRPQPKMGVLRESWDKSHSKQGDEWRLPRRAVTASRAGGGVSSVNLFLSPQSCMP